MLANCLDKLLWSPRLTLGELLALLSPEGDFLPEGGCDTLAAGGDCDADGPLLGLLVDFLEPRLGVACLLDFLEFLLGFLEKFLLDLPEFFVV